MKARIPRRRWEQIQLGTIYNDTKLDTSDASQAKIVGLALLVSLEPEYTCDWKGADGDWVSLDAQAALGIATAIRAFIQGCYDWERAPSAAVDDGIFSEDMLDEGWPRTTGT